MNELLYADFSTEEIKRAAFDVSALKAPRPDGFSAGFFHNSWNIIEADVVKGVGRILRNEEGLARWNETLITLVPKKNKPEKVSDFHSISLSNVCYKIVAKVLANRWR